MNYDRQCELIDDQLAAEREIPIPLSMMHHVVSWANVGSRFTCVPAPTDTDHDVLILTDYAVGFRKAAKKAGFEESSEYIGGERDDCLFVSFRKDDVNLIVTTKMDFYRKFMLATGLAKRFNLQMEADRVALFQGILYGKEVSCSG